MTKEEEQVIDKVCGEAADKIANQQSLIQLQEEYIDYLHGENSIYSNKGISLRSKIEAAKSKI